MNVLQRGVPSAGSKAPAGRAPLGEWNGVFTKLGVIQGYWGRRKRWRNRARFPTCLAFSVVRRRRKRANAPFGADPRGRKNENFAPSPPGHETIICVWRSHKGHRWKISNQTGMVQYDAELSTPDHITNSLNNVGGTAQQGDVFQRV
jgi:hypothetical protein